MMDGVAWPERVDGPWRRVALLGGLAALLALLPLPFAGSPGLPGWIVSLPFVLAPCAVGAAALATRTGARAEARGAWTLVALACVMAAVGRGLAPLGGSDAFPTPSDGFAALFHLLIAASAILALRPARDPRWALEIALDGLLVLLTAAVLVLRFTLEPALAAGWIALDEGAALLVGQVSVVGSLLCCALLALWRDSELAATSIDALFIAALIFSFVDALGGTGGVVAPGRSALLFEGLRILGWSALGLSAVFGWRDPGPTIATAGRTSVARRSRMVVIPAAVLFLSVWALGGQAMAPMTALSRATTIALGCVLALRVGVALYSVEREGRERQGAEARASRARIRAITAQMSPHFLFNTLHSLSALLRRDSALAETALERLGSVLRYGLDRGEDPLPLSDEWAFTQSYLELEQIRLGPRLRVDSHLEEDALEALVPPFVLQPLVENAIRHGIDADPAGGSISVLAVVVGDTLTIEVRDSGEGADEESMRNASGVGVRGVRAQLASFFGEDGRMEVERKPGAFIVRLVLPVVDD